MTRDENSDGREAEIADALAQAADARESHEWHTQPADARRDTDALLEAGPDASGRSDTISIACTEWGHVNDGKPVHRYTMRSRHGVTVSVSDLGASLLSWRTPDRDGQYADIVLGFDTPAEYLASSTHMGGTIGRVANRIAGAQFALDGHVYPLDANDGGNTLHGGWQGFDRALWTATVLDTGVRFAHVSADGDSGFPGRLTIIVDYQLSCDGADSTLRIDYTARAEAPTPLNLTCHPYFNLAGKATALDHLVEVDAAQVLVTDASGIPNAIIDVAGTALDLRTPARLRERVTSDEKAIRAVGGIDHCFVLRDPPTFSGTLHHAAGAIDPVSGRRLRIATTQAGLQVYTATNLEGVIGRNGQRHHRFDAVCFEAQGWPNQINSSNAEACVLRPGETYRETTLYTVDITR